MTSIGVQDMNDFILQKKSDIGLIRENNEDAVLAINHPKNKNIKLLALADGMGGKDLGEVASNFVIKSISDWFTNIKIDFLNNTEKLEDSLKKMISKWNNQLIEKYGNNRLGTTLTLSIVLENQTLVLNIGDSRCYIYKNNKLTQVTEDDSQVWTYYKSGIANKEDLRFFSTSNIINACIGLSSNLCNCTTTILDNDSYDILLLLTDGVTDLLTDAKIKELITKHKKKEILDRIIQEAVYVEQNLRVPPRVKRNFREPFYVPKNGKDNASGVIFIKNIV